jgi:hypothetical protein
MARWIWRKIAAAIKQDDFHFARTRLLALENTMQGKVLPLAYLQAARELTHERRGLRSASGRGAVVSTRQSNWACTAAGD